MKILSSLLLVILGLFLNAHIASAQGVNNFVINNFKASYVIDNDAVGGSLLTTETIDLTYSAQNRGILRAIPEEHRGYSTKLDVRSVERDGKKEPFTTYSDNGNIVLKIGDPDVYITGRHSYKIVYYQERIMRLDDSREFYWDINGTGWSQPFESVIAEVSFKNKQLKPLSPYCFTGSLGSKEQACSISEVDNKIVFTSKRILKPGENMTLSVQVNGGVFSKPGVADVIKDNIGNIVGLLPGLVLAGYAVVLWHRNGRDYKGRGVIVTEYQPPEDLSPAEVGMLADYKVNTRDLSATLIDLAVRGYIRLHETEKRILGFKSRSYEVEIIKIASPGELKPHEASLIDGIFEDQVLGSRVAMNSLDKTKMHNAVNDSRENIEKNLVNTYGLLEKRANSMSKWFIIAGSILFFIAFFVFQLSVGLGIGLIVSGLAFLGLGLVMPRRSPEGVEIYERIKGLELYMNTAEKDRLKMLQGVDRPYAEPSKTVELFEKLLPYAVALGVEKSWAKQFDGILTDLPSWYESNSASTFNVAYLASGITSATSSFSKSFESNSGSSGSSGSSGGGGGGGGGGGW